MPGSLETPGHLGPASRNDPLEISSQLCLLIRSNCPPAAPACPRLPLWESPGNHAWGEGVLGRGATWNVVVCLPANICRYLCVPGRAAGCPELGNSSNTISVLRGLRVQWEIQAGESPVLTSDLCV